MRIFKRKTKHPLVKIFLLLLILGAGGFFFFNSIKKASAEWFDQNWHYRKSIAVTNNTTSQNNVYISVTIDTSDTTRFNNNCGDLRFTKMSGQLLPYYIVSGCRGASTVIHVNFDTFPAGAQTIYYYYGNPSAANGFSASDFSTVASNYTIGSLGSEETGPGPVAYWKFDEGQGLTAYDNSSNHNSGTLSGATKPIWQTGDMCVAGKCLKFDGSTSYVSITGVNLEPPQSKTAEAWIYYPSTPTNQGILGTDNGLANGSRKGWGIIIDTSVEFEIVDGSKNACDFALTIPPAGIWHHLALVQDYGNNKLYAYLDGTRMGQQNCTGFTPNGSNFTIGELFGSWYFKGSIDDIKIYPYARTGAQIQADYNARGSSFGTSAQIGNQSAWMTNGLVGYWKMDEASWNGTAGEVIDSSGAGNNGTAYNGATTGTGKFGNGGSFDGSNDYVDVGNGASLNTTGAVTISAWVNTNTLSIPNGHRMILYDGDDASYLSLEGDGSGEPFFSLYINGAQQTLPSYYSLTINTWYHVVATYDGNVMKIYVNGVLQNTSPSYPGTISSTNSKYIGEYSTAGYNFSGLIDDFRIYNRALSPKEVSDLYSWAPGPVGWWKMDDKVSGNSQTLIDSSGYGNNGTTYWGANASGMNCKVLGKYATGCQFDGVDDYVGIPTFGNTAQTQEGWFYFTNLAYFKNYHNSLFSNLYQHNANNDIYINGTNDLFAYTFLPNTWYHIAFVYTNINDDSTAKLYVNGVAYSVGQQAGPHTISSVTTISSSPTNDGFTGIIDNVQIYNYARTQKQILQDMSVGSLLGGNAGKGYAAYWKLDEGYGNTVHDMSVNANTGTIYGASWTNDGKFGKALVFNGTIASNDYVSFPNNIITSTEFTISAWAKMNGPSDGTGENAIFEQRDDAMGDNHSAVTLEADNPLNIDFGVRSSVGTEQDISAPHPSSYGQWHHYVGVVSSTTISLYIDGVLINSVANNQTGNYITSISYRDIGRARYGGYTEGIFNGIIDEVKVYNFALTADDIKTEYNRGALKMGSVSDTSGLTGGSIASNSASAAYCIPGDTAPCAGSVGEWKFDENVSGNSQTLYDTSGNGNNAITSGNVNCKVLGVHATGCQFDGTDNASVANSSVLDGAKTFEFWAKIPTISAGSSIGILSKMNGSGGYAFWAGFNGSQYYLGSGFNGTNCSLSTSTPINPYINKLTHYTETITSSGCSVYVNGVWLNTNPAFTGTPASNTAPLYLGQDYWWTGNFFQGLLDEVRIFNYARTPAQIAWDYNRGKPVGWWKFDECQGTTAYDASGNGNNGTITIGGTGTQTTAGTCTTPTDGTGAWYNGKVGKYNSSMSFDGTDDYVTVPNSSSLQFTNGITEEAWIKLNNANSAGSGSYPMILCKSQGSPRMGYDLLFNNSTHAVATELWNNGWIGEVDSNKNSWVAGQWYHIVATFQYETSGSGNVKIYINGVLDNTATANSVIMGTDTQSVIIGAYNGSGSDNFNGFLDDIKIYNYALTPQQILMDYNQGAAVRFGPVTGKP